MRKRPGHTLLAIALLLAGCAGETITPVPSALSAMAPRPPAAGDTADYRIVNRYNGVVLGELHTRVDKIDHGRVVVLQTSTVPGTPSALVAIYTPEGNWLRHALPSHNQTVDYDFAPAYPAYAFPLDQGKSWSVRVNATDPATGRRNSVRVDGEVLGAERIATPAGTFDTIKVRRRVYAGDWDGFLYETNITEVDWYSPELGRAVRSETNSAWRDLRRSPGGMLRDNQWMRGDWEVLELVGYSRK